jgi:predicted dehydrogenase
MSSTPARKVRIGVISTARIGWRQVIPATQLASNCEVVAISSRDSANARRWADQLGIAKAYGSHEELLADPEIDAVYNPLPNHLHAEWTMKAASAGKHVLCEKPFTLTAAEAEQAAAHCAAHGVVLMEAFMYRFHPSWIEAKRLVDGGAIGVPTTVQGWFSYHNTDTKNIRNIAEYGGGALYDIGCYPISASRLIFGSEPEVVGATILRDRDLGVDTVTSAILRFGDASATFTCSTRVEPDQRMHIYGDEGVLTVDIPFNIPPDRHTRIQLSHGGQRPVNPDAHVISFAPCDQYTSQAEVFANAILTGTAPPFGGDDAVANMRVIDAVFAAANG